VDSRPPEASPSPDLDVVGAQNPSPSERLFPSSDPPDPRRAFQPRVEHLAADPYSNTYIATVTDGTGTKRRFALPGRVVNAYATDAAYRQALNEVAAKVANDLERQAANEAMPKPGQHA
jgi:hypothetical protein